jgi:hypothetical protein
MRSFHYAVRDEILPHTAQDVLWFEKGCASSSAGKFKANALMYLLERQATSSTKSTIET